MARAKEKDTSQSRGYHRKEAVRFVQGKGCYVDDIKLSGAVHAVFVRSTVARGTVTDVHTEAARACPGVLAVLSGADLVDELQPYQGPEGPLSRLSVYPLTLGEIHYVGEPLVVVVADARDRAQDAADAVVVDFDILPALVDPEEALRSDADKVFASLASNLVQEAHIASDGIEQAFAEADHTITERLKTQRLAPSPLEPRACAAALDPSTGQLTLWSSTATVHTIRREVSEALGIGENQLRVVAPDVGGSFGGKVHPYAEDVVVAYLARRLGRAVKWTETRIEHLTNVRHGRDQTHDVEVAVRNDGRIVALRDRIVADLGATCRFVNSMQAAALYVTGAYDIQCYQVDAYGVVTNKTPQGPVRGIGKADASYVIERLMDVIAHRLRLDPAEVRMRNFVPEDAFPYRTATGAVLDSGRYAVCLNRTLELADYAKERETQKQLRAQGLLRGIGMSPGH